MITERKIQDQFYLYNQTRFNTIVPNCYPPRWFECDLLAITSASYMYEFEIKLSRTDFLNDRNKGRTPEYLKEYYGKFSENYGKTKYEQLVEGHKYGPSKFWYIVPENLLTEADIPSFAGWLCFVERGKNLWFKELKKAPRLHKHKFSEEAKDNIRHKLCARYWRERNHNNNI